MNGIENTRGLAKQRFEPRANALGRDGTAALAAARRSATDDIGAILTAWIGAELTAQVAHAWSDEDPALGPLLVEFVDHIIGRGKPFQIRLEEGKGVAAYRRQDDDWTIVVIATP